MWQILSTPEQVQLTQVQPGQSAVEASPCGDKEIAPRSSNRGAVVVGTNKRGCASSAIQTISSTRPPSRTAMVNAQDGGLAAIRQCNFGSLISPSRHRGVMPRPPTAFDKGGLVSCPKKRSCPLSGSTRAAAGISHAQRLSRLVERASQSRSLRRYNRDHLRHFGHSVLGQFP